MQNKTSYLCNILFLTNIYTFFWLKLALPTEGMKIKSTLQCYIKFTMMRSLDVIQIQQQTLVFQ